MRSTNRILFIKIPQFYFVPHRALRSQTRFAWQHQEQTMVVLDISSSYSNQHFIPGYFNAWGGGVIRANSGHRNGLGRKRHAFRCGACRIDGPNAVAVAPGRGAVGEDVVIAKPPRRELGGVRHGPHHLAVAGGPRSAGSGRLRHRRYPMSRGRRNGQASAWSCRPRHRRSGAA